MAKKIYTGINIQYPISQLILTGEKTIETRTYPIPAQYLDQEMLMIETPGKSGNFKARAIAVIKFTSCYKYKNPKDFYDDQSRHKVDKDSMWAWKDKPKYGWEIKIVQRLQSPKELKKKKGIVYTKGISL